MKNMTPMLFQEVIKKLQMFVVGVVAIVTESKA